ncbi:MAG: ribosome biogenesis GTPase Der [Candidatus Gracilibacteria bacterium]|jgi:GTP-binding protein
MLPIVAIVGKPNTGKSTLFNKLLGQRRAIESEIAGTTRDRLMCKTRLNEYQAYLVDTGGITVAEGDSIEANVKEQAKIAIDGADIIVFVADGSKALSSEDFNVVDILRKSGKPIILVANKCDNQEIRDNVYSLSELGFGNAVPVSALHKFGLDSLVKYIEDEIEELGFDKNVPIDEFKTIRVSFLGTPNVGKSSLINAILGRKEVIVSDVPGTTRDSVEVEMKYKEHRFVFVDTAGVRKSGKVEKGIEKFSVLRSLRAIEDSDVTVLVLDYSKGIISQDMHISSEIIERGNGLVLVVNKSDLMDEPKKNEDWFISTVLYKFDFLPWAPLVFTSAKNKKGIGGLLDVVANCYNEREKKVSQSDLKFWLEETIAKHEPAGSYHGKKNKILSIKQDGIKPPSFTVRTRYPGSIHFSYKRYLENKLREKFGFNGTAIRIDFR